MQGLRTGTIGITPPGALGVALFYHLTSELKKIDGSVFFLERERSKSCESLRQSGRIIIEDKHGAHAISADQVLKPDLLKCYERGELPEVLLVCTNPDQLLEIVSAVVMLLERIFEHRQLHNGALEFPKVVLCANGIYFQRIRQLFIEKLEESTLLGRLPDLWPNLMPFIVGHLLRGITIQTGLREGSGALAIYHPGPSGITRIAGGGTEERERCWQLCQNRGAWFELAAHNSPTRLEFDKAMVNLSSNLLGQIFAIEDDGTFFPLTVREIMTAEHEEDIRMMTYQIFRVGQAVKAYSQQEQFEEIFKQLKATCLMHAAHVPSSIQWIGLRLKLGNLEPSVTPTEAWLLDPLIRYAASAGLDESALFFARWRDRLIERLRLAIKANQKSMKR